MDLVPHCSQPADLARSRPTALNSEDLSSSGSHTPLLLGAGTTPHSAASQGSTMTMASGEGESCSPVQIHSDLACVHSGRPDSLHARGDAAAAVVGRGDGRARHACQRR
jgi:hypothetical protein